MTKTTFAVHATGTPPDKDLTRRDIDIEDRRMGYAQIGYHYVIRRDGTVETGRELSSPSMHESSISRCRASVSVLLIGGCDAEGNPANNFTDAQRRALKTLHIQQHPDLGVVYVHPALKL